MQNGQIVSDLPVLFSSGAEVAGRDHRVARPARSPHETARLHPRLHPLGCRPCTPFVHNLHAQAACPDQGLIFLS